MPTGNPDYTQNVKIIGKDPSGDPVVVALDASGNIVAVLKGEYNNTLQTLATDAEGRLIAVVDDPLNIFDSRARIGNAELAARLGSPNRWDRRGSIIHQDSFQDGLTHSEIMLGTAAASVKITSDRALTGGYSAKLVTPAVADEWVQLLQYLTLPTYTGKVGLESHFASKEPTGTLHISLSIYTGSRVVTTILRVALEDRIVYFNDPVSPDNDTGKKMGYCENDYVWHGWKVVVDLNPGVEKYVRVLIEEAEVDLSDWWCYARDNDSPPFAYLIFKVTTPAGGNAQTIYIDDLIVTIAEPD